MGRFNTNTYGVWTDNTPRRVRRRHARRYHRELAAELDALTRRICGKWLNPDWTRSIGRVT